jgi:ribosomal protein L11 methylase PrmA
MIQDKVRTATYASFILKNPSLFKDAIVLDVGCGTGILSLFAARAGAKCVFAVDASDIALKAEKIVKANRLDHIIKYVSSYLHSDYLLIADIQIIGSFVAKSRILSYLKTSPMWT